MSYISCNNFSTSHGVFLASIAKIVEPSYYQEDVKDPRWQKAIAEEIHALEENQTWTIEDSLSKKKPINSEWVYKVEH